MAQTIDQVAAQLRTRDMRNGAVNTIRPIFLTGGLPSAYHWVGEWSINDPNAGTAAALTDENFLFVVAAIYSAALAGTVADPTKRRSTAMLLAAGRRAVTLDWMITQADVVPTQLSAVSVTYDATANDAITINTPHTNVMVTSAVVSAEFAAMAATDEVTEALTKAMKIGAATPVTQGVVLVQTGQHHFVESHYSVFRAVVKQVYGQANVTVLALDQTEYEDVMGHKVSHPIKSELMMTWARSEAVKIRFIAAAFESPVVRVPAKTDSESAMSAVGKILGRTETTMKRFNVGIGNIVAEVNDKMVSLSNDIAANPSVEARAPIEAAAVAEMEKMSAGIAFSYGFYLAMLDDSERREAGESLSKSKFLRRMGTEEFGMRDEGRQAYDLGRKYFRAQVREGYLPGVGLFGAETPARLTPIEAVNSTARTAGA